MKFPFEYVARHVDELFIKSEDISDVEIDKSCQLASTLITACGWSETEFWKVMYGHNSPADQEELSKLN